MTTYRDAGFVAEAFGDFLALLGWSPAGSEECGTAKFSLSRTDR